jgi:RTX calcium-binding nonapeptide repeat (4 copies)
MRRNVLLGAVVAVALILGTGAVALADAITCKAGTDCRGTNRADTLTGSPGMDMMFGRAGGDLLKGNAGRDEMEGGLGADRVLGGFGNDEVVWGGEQRRSSSSFTYPDKSGDIAAGGRGGDRVYGGFGQGGVDRVYGNRGNDTIIVAQRGFTKGDVKVTREVVDCGRGEDTVYRDRRLDVIANNCEHKRNGFPAMMVEARDSSSAKGGLFGEASSGQ